MLQTTPFTQKPGTCRGLLLIQALFLLTFGSTPCDSAELKDYQDNDLIISTCKVDLRRDMLKMFWKDENNGLLNGFPRLREWLTSRGEDVVCATNAGIFDEEFRPLGLYIENGKILRKLNVRKNAYGNFYLQPNGVFIIRDGQAEIIDTDHMVAEKDQILDGILFATQSGPLLIQNRQVNPLFPAESENRLIRNAVCTISQNEVVLAISRGPISFYALASFLKKIGCTNALYLDGKISRMYPGNDYDIGHRFGALIAVTKKTATGR